MSINHDVTQTFDVTYFFNFLTHSPLEGFSHAFNSLTTYAGKKVTIGVGHFQIIDFFYDW